VFGHLGDRIGRKRALIATLYVMGFATLAIGLLPAYSAAGALAPILLVLCRFVQGIGLGGEWAGAVLMGSEQAAHHRRGLAASWVQVGAPAGNLLATAVLGVTSAVLPEPAFEAWGWRVPFLLSAVLVGVGLWLRVSAIETAEFRSVGDAVVKAPLREVLRHYPGRVFLAMAVRIAPDISYYIWTVFLYTYLAHLGGVPRQVAVDAVLVGSAAQLVVIPVAGHLSDRWGRRPVYLAGALGTLVWGGLFFALLDTRQPVLVFVAALGGLVCHGVMFGPQGALISELFPTTVRYSGAALGSQLSGIVGGGLAPLLATALLTGFGSPLPVAVYVGVSAVVTTVAVAFLSGRFLARHATTATDPQEVPAS
jgi:MFS family permease